MFTAFSTALSALNGESTAINLIGNNLANMNTTGYKSTEAEFSDLMAQTMGSASNPAQVGMGLAPAMSFRQFTQGSITATTNPTDAAIQGNGFFVVKDQNNQNLFTRDGSFQIDGNGNLVTATGQNAQGWTTPVGGTLNPNGPVGNITVPTTTLPAVATTTMSMSVNLASSSPTTGTGSTFSAPIQVFDAQGTAHTLTVTYTKTDVNSWSYNVTIPTADLKAASSGGTTPTTPAPVDTSVSTGTLTFDDKGNLTSPAASSDPQKFKVTGLADGATDLSIGWNLYSNGTPSITQYDQASGVASTKQDGVAAGQINGVSVQNGGLVVASYTNGQQATIGQLALASITNPESLVAVGNNDLAASATTAQPTIGTANSSGRGQIIGGSLENSNVDMATEFTNLLTAQRSYQAASRVITTSDELLQETVNLIHA